MKRFALFCLLLMGLFSFNACQKELTDPNGTGVIGGTGDFRAKINGVQWVASVSGASKMSGVISVFGAGGGKQIAITLQDSGVHHYTLSLVSLQAGALTDS